MQGIPARGRILREQAARRGRKGEPGGLEVEERVLDFERDSERGMHGRQRRSVEDAPLEGQLEGHIRG